MLDSLLHTRATPFESSPNHQDKGPVPSTNGCCQGRHVCVKTSQPQTCPASWELGLLGSFEAKSANACTCCQVCIAENCELAVRWSGVAASCFCKSRYVDVGLGHLQSQRMPPCKLPRGSEKHPSAETSDGSGTTACVSTSWGKAMIPSAPHYRAQVVLDHPRRGSAHLSKEDGALALARIPAQMREAARGADRQSSHVCSDEDHASPGLSVTTNLLLLNCCLATTICHQHPRQPHKVPNHRSVTSFSYNF